MMAKVPLPRGQGEPPAPEEVMGNLDQGEMAHPNFKLPKPFKKECCMFALTHDYETPTEMLYAALDR